MTFEVLLASFGLESDPALIRMGALVHYLDVGGISVPEAAGLTAAQDSMSVRSTLKCSFESNCAFLALRNSLLD